MVSLVIETGGFGYHGQSRGQRETGKLSPAVRRRRLLRRLTLRGSPGMTPRRVPVYLLQVYLHLGGRYAFDVGSVPPPGGKYTQAAARRGPSGPAPLAAMTSSISAAVFSRPAFLGWDSHGVRTGLIGG